MDNILAKSTKNGGTTLVNHTKMVLNMGMEIANNFSFSEKYREHLAIALMLHDIGKCSTWFQKHIAKSELDDDGLETYKNIKYYHNTLSWAFAVSCVMGLHKLGDVTSAILYHHSVRDDKKCIAKDIISDVISEDGEAYNSMCDFYREMCQYIDSKFGMNICSNPKYSLITDISELEGSNVRIDNEMLYQKTVHGHDDNFRSIMEFASFSSIIRAIVVYCDRAISSLNFDNGRILDNDTEYIDDIFEVHNASNIPSPNYDGYDKDRLNIQLELVKSISNSEVSHHVMQACAGFGKTLMGLLWYFSNNKKVMWVLPRLVIGRSTYDSVISELNKMGINDKVKVGLYMSGRFEKCNFTSVEECNPEDCDIFITNIDSFLSRYSKNNMSSLLIDSYNGNIIFDEYHEFVSDAPLFSAFINTMYIRKCYTNSKTLLLSASGFNLDKFWGVEDIKYWEDEVPIIFGDVKVNINIEDITDTNPSKVEKNSFTILPTVRMAQQLYIDTVRDSVIIHARFTDDDRNKIEKNVFSMYGKHAEADKKPVIGTNIIGVGLDISAKTINDMCFSPEDTIQRCCGRGSRYGEYDEIDYNVLTSSKIDKFVSKTYSVELYNKWIEVLSEYNGKQVTKKDLYRLRNEFIDKNKKKIDSYLESLYNDSVIDLMSIYHTSGSNSRKSDSKSIAKGMTYRGDNDSYFVTVKTENGYIDPIVCDDVILRNDTSNKERYDFMLKPDDSRFSYPNKYMMRNAFGIKDNRDASVDNCKSIAKNSKSPLLLFDYEYNDCGLYYIGDIEY